MYSGKCITYMSKPVHFFEKILKLVDLIMGWLPQNDECFSAINFKPLLSYNVVRFGEFAPKLCIPESLYFSQFILGSLPQNDENIFIKIINVVAWLLHFGEIAPKWLKILGVNFEVIAYIW